MGSCDNSLEVHEPLQQADIEQHHLCSIKNSGSEKLPCLEAAGFGVINHNVVPTGALDGRLEFSQNDSAVFVSSSDLMDAASVDRGIGLACEGENVVDFVPRMSLEVECGNERPSEIDECKVEPDGLCVEKVGSSNENNGSVNSLEYCEMSMELVMVPMSGSIRNHDQQDEQKDDCSGNVQRGMEEKSNGLAATETDTCDQIMPSSDCQMAAELRSVDDLPRNGVEQDKQDIGATLERATVVMENKTFGLVGTETDIQSQMWSSLDHETLSELIMVTGPLSNCVQQDDQKDEQIINSPSAEEVREFMEENINVSPTIDSTRHNQLFSCQGFDKSLESMPKIVSPGETVKREEQNDDGSVSLPSEEGVMEKKSDLLARVKANTNDQILSSLDAEMQVESDSFSGFLRDSCQHNDLEAKTVSVKSDASSLMESDVCTQKTLHSIEMPKESSLTGCLVSTCERWNDQKNDKDVNCLTAEMVPTDILKRSDVDRYIQAYPSQVCQRTLENLAVANSLDNCDHKNEQRNDSGVNGPSVESMPDIVEEESDVTTEIKVEIHSQKFCTEVDAYDLKEGSPEITPNSAQSCLPFGKDVFLATYSSSAADCSEHTGNEGKDPAGSCPSKTICPHISSSSSRRSSRVCKSCQKTQTKRAAKKCKNKAKLRDLQIFKAERRKRSCFSKPARSSNWGLLGNITQFFEQSNGLGLNEIQNHGPSKIMVDQGSGKRNNSRASGSSQRSSGKKHAAATGIRLKVIVGKEVGQNSLDMIVPEVIDTAVSDVVSEYETKSYLGTSFEIPNFVNGVEDKMREKGAKHLQCFGNKLEEAKVHSNASVSNLHVADKDFEGTVISQKSAGDASGDYLGVPSRVEVDSLGAVVEKRYADPGTSPDSEVINLVPEGQVIARCQEDFPDAVLTSSNGKKGKKKDRRTHASEHFAEDISPDMASMNNVKATKKHGGRQRKDDGFFSKEILISPTSANASSNSSSCKEFSEEQLHMSIKTELGVSTEALQAEVSAETKICSGLDVGVRLSESQNSNNLPSTKSKSKGCRLPRKSDGVNKGRSKASDKARNKRANGCRQRGSEQKSVNKNKVKEKSDRVVFKSEDDPETGNCFVDDIGKTNPCDNIASKDLANLDMASSDVVEQRLHVDNAWVRCDDCHKWRRIPVALVDSIGHTNCQWICKNNMDKAFADCSTPQEKSNAEINAELGLSDADEDACDVPSKNKGLECKRTTVSKEHEFTRISTNQFLYRNRKTQTIDEIMVCHCKLHPDGGLGCGDECLNRILNIECVQGTCPCGDLCSNQQFQKRKYAKMKWTRCGKKGFGLRLEEDISKGQFLIEYVGEVLDMHTYEARQREYASKGHKHFYFMTLNGSEVIDACAKGNLGRFINHSCDPNCRTEKWVVNGEICIGLFALRDINKGEEVTFDYNYVRVVGAAAKRCYCGSPQCRGYIGGDPTSTEVIDQVDSDEEFPEPVMLEDGEAADGFKNRISRTSSFDGVELRVRERISKDTDKMDNSTTASGKMEVASEIDSMNQSVSAISQSHSPMEMDDSKGNVPSSSQPEISVQADGVASKSASAVKQEISKEEIQRWETSPTTMLSKSSDGMVVNRKSKSATAEEKRVFVKSRFLIKTSHDFGSTKKGKFNSNPMNVNKVQMVSSKSHVLSIKTKRFMDGTSNGRFEAVEEKLNELLDADGGISKRKDAPKVYLKLLLLTAASGASGNGEAIQSNRDLSMILDALLKTKSRVVLIDIINKNGLRMLHNMIKQYRKDFKKIPILRKLLKVLEYLAVREILTSEHINGGPPCPGMESFKESMLSLTEHNDKQVHQIARNFRDRWIPRHGRKYSFIDRDDGRMEFHRGSISNRVSVSQNHACDLGARPIEATDSATQSKLVTPSLDTAVHEGCSAPSVGDVTKTRKRKSRWDQPAKEKPSSRSLQHEQKIQSELLQKSEHQSPPDMGKELLDNVDKGSKEDSYCPHCALNYGQQDEASCADDGRQNIQSDVPPGFSSPLKPTLVSSSASLTISELPQQNGCLVSPDGIVVGHPQRKFISRLSVSYGVPLPIVQQFGSPQDGTVESWAIAPGMPFHPFPPLPPFPQHKKETPSSAVNSMEIDETAEEGRRDKHDPATCYPNENNPSTTGANQPDMDIPSENGQQTFKRARGSSHDLGRRYFRQQKWNKVLPPWIRNRDGWGYLGNNARGGICSTDAGSVTNDHRNSYCSQDLSCRVEKGGNCINQQNST